MMRQSAVRGKGFHGIVRKIERWFVTVAAQSVGMPWDAYDQELAQGCGE
jgi:hypothetical protein